MLVGVGVGAGVGVEVGIGVGVGVGMGVGVTVEVGVGVPVGSVVGAGVGVSLRLWSSCATGVTPSWAAACVGESLGYRRLPACYGHRTDGQRQHDGEQRAGWDRVNRFSL